MTVCTKRRLSPLTLKTTHVPEQLGKSQKQLMKNSVLSEFVSESEIMFVYLNINTFTFFKCCISTLSQTVTLKL